MRDNAIGINCKKKKKQLDFSLESMSKTSFFLGLWNIQHQDLKVLPRELNSRMWAWTPNHSETKYAVGTNPYHS